MVGAFPFGCRKIRFLWLLHNLSGAILCSCLRSRSFGSSLLLANARARHRAWPTWHTCVGTPPGGCAARKAREAESFAAFTSSWGAGLLLGANGGGCAVRGAEGNLLSWAVSWGFGRFGGSPENATGTAEVEDDFAGSSFR